MPMLSKNELRQKLRAQRKAVPNQAEKDHAILFQQLQFLEEFKSAETLLCYLSLPEEIDTDAIIDFALEKGKTVAVPYCVDNNGNMEFYVLKTFEDLHIGAFGVREPDISKCKRLTEYVNSVCIVPGIAFDKNGHRLGYGKGYYDRFLKNYPFISIGLCYNSLIQNELPIEVNDIPVNIIITESQCIGGNNG